MAEDRLGKFLFENGVAPDEFAHFKNRIIGADIAVIETAKYRSFVMTDERGQMVYKLVPENASVFL